MDWLSTRPSNKRSFEREEEGCGVFRLRLMGQSGRRCLDSPYSHPATSRSLHVSSWNGDALCFLYSCLVRMSWSLATLSCRTRFREHWRALDWKDGAKLFVWL